MKAKNRSTSAAAPHEAYPVKTVARLTGLTPDLIRAWERRYAVVAPIRGARGARLYTSADVAHLRLLAGLVARGRAIGDIAGMDPDALRRIAQEELPASGDTLPPPITDDEAVLARVLAALNRFDAGEVERLLGESLLALGVREFVSRIGVPLLETIGERWRTGELSVAEEHLVSAMLRSLFGGLIRLRAPQGAPAILLASPSGERHELGLSVVALLSLQAGVPVAYAGVDLPADEVVAAARKLAVPAVGLSVVSSENRRTAVEQIRRIEAGLPPDVEIWLGGRDAAEVNGKLGHSRALVLQRVADIDAEIQRLAEHTLSLPGPGA